MNKLERKQLLEKAKRKNMEQVLLVSTYMRQLPSVHSKVRQHLDTLYTSAKMRKIFQELPIVAYRRNRNLGDLLVRGKTKW